MIDATHWETLGRMDPPEVVRRARAACDPHTGEYRLRMLTDELLISPASRTVRWAAAPPDGKPPGFHYWLTSVVYLISARDQPPSGEWTSATALPYGEFFFRGPHALPTAPVAEAFGDRPELFDRAAERLGGVPWPSAPHTFRLQALPRVPVLVQLWERDEEFPARANFLFDRLACDHLAVDALLSLCHIVSSRLVAAGRNE